MRNNKIGPFIKINNRLAQFPIIQAVGANDVKMARLFKRCFSRIISCMKLPRWAEIILRNRFILSAKNIVVHPYLMTEFGLSDG